MSSRRRSDPLPLDGMMPTEEELRALRRLQPPPREGLLRHPERLQPPEGLPVPEERLHRTFEGAESFEL